MRLWHQALIPLLDRQRLLGQHRECCALRGNGWGKKHSVVDYVFRYDRQRLYDYHILVMKEMFRRGYNIDSRWWYYKYRGKNCELDRTEHIERNYADCIYNEHNPDYLNECLDNLIAKGINLKDHF